MAVQLFVFFTIILFACIISCIGVNLIDFVEFDGLKYQVPSSLSNSDRSRPRNAILLLVRKVSVNKTLEIIHMANEMIHDHHRADLIIFHGSFPYKDEIALLRNSSLRNIDFIHVDSILNRVSHVENFEPYDVDPTWTKLDKVKWSYHHMIRFWFSDIFHMPSMRNVEYYLRLDDDSRITTRTPNLFNRMRRARGTSILLSVTHKYTNSSFFLAIYMCNDIFEESYKSLPGTEKLQEFTENYLANTGWKPLNHRRYKLAFPGNKTVLLFYNNFELAQKDFFLTEPVLNWTKSVIESGGIYRYRWGDAPLRYLTIVIFARENQVIHRHKQDFEYCHGKACTDPETFAHNHTIHYWVT